MRSLALAEVLRFLVRGYFVVLMLTVVKLRVSKAFVYESFEPKLMLIVWFLLTLKAFVCEVQYILVLLMA